MFKESPFTGACAYATYEVLVMLIGTMLLGLLLGYLIWGWLRRHVVVLKNDAVKQKRIADLRQAQIASLNTRMSSLEIQLERAETKLSLSEFRMRRAQEELESIKEQPRDEQAITISLPEQTTPTQPENKKEEDRQHRAELPTDEPTLADITRAMESGTLHTPIRESTGRGSDDKIHLIPTREISAESLDMARKVFNHEVEPDDLQIIYGIDQKMDDNLRRAGIHSWVQLSQTALPDLRRIIEDAGPRYRDVDPKTWTIQARMACKEEWKKLKMYQEGLMGE